MENPLLISLVVSGIGMLMLFVALSMLYGLIYLMTAVIREKPGPAVQPAPIPGHVPGAGGLEARQRKQRAAAIAVALARAELGLLPDSPSGVTEALGASPWRALHHQRLLTQNQRVRRDR